MIQRLVRSHPSYDDSIPGDERALVWELPIQGRVVIWRDLS